MSKKEWFSFKPDFLATSSGTSSGNALDRDLVGTLHGTGAFGDGRSHLPDVAIDTVIEDENLGHRGIA
jgi:hypothetical protein